MDAVMNVDTVDQTMMRRCIDLAKASGKAGEYPYAAVICKDGQIVAESTNRVRRDRDVARHAEIVAISTAQKHLNTVSLDDCEIYSNAEPCALCSFAIRESRIRRVIYALKSPHMGGLSKWNVLGDTDLSTTMPEVFAPPPDIVSGYMAEEAEHGLFQSNRLIAEIMRRRGLFVAPGLDSEVQLRSAGYDRMLRFLRRNFFDHFGRC